VTEPPAGDNSAVKTETVPVEQGTPESPAAQAAVDQAKADPAVSQEGKEGQGDRTTTTEVRKALQVPSSVHVAIDSKNLVDYVGPPRYQRERIYTKRTPPGVSTGLGYLGDGAGSVMPIEATVMPGSGILLTGKLGEVIKESAQIALSFIKTHAHTLGLTVNATDDILDKRAIHVHMPEGSIGKGGSLRPG
jgi:Lon-like ATP-dependent protease